MRRPILSLVLALTLAAPVAAQVPQSEYSARRAEVARRVGEGVVLAFGSRATVDYTGSYRQLPSFRYLTGWERPNAVFLMEVRGGRPTRALLFEPAIDPRSYLYDGFPLDSAEVATERGLTLLPLERLEPTLHDLFELPILIISDVHSRDYVHADSLTRGRAFVAHVSEHHPEVVFRSLDPLLDSLRLSKSDAEVELLREAIHVTVDALETAMRVIEPGMNEGEVEAVIEYSYRLSGARKGFASIIGSGPNSTSYHYIENSRDMQAGDVVVMDVGAEVHGYTADVTRTVPVDGTFSAEQRAIYQIVLEAQQAAVAEIRPGAATRLGDDAVRRVIARGLARLGLIQAADARLDPPWSTPERCNATPVPLNCTQAFLYMAHGLGHGIGLEVHDVGGHSYSFSGRFAEGEVLTVEPGVYVSETLLDMLPDTERNRAFIAAVRERVRQYANIGVRIEDDYLVTSDGVEWLSPAPREIRDIESMMARDPSLPLP